MIRLLALLTACLSLAACGVRGPLYLPEETATEAPAEADPQTPPQEKDRPAQETRDEAGR